MSHILFLPVDDGEWLLQNHRVHHMEKARRVKAIRTKAGWLARADLTPQIRPVAVYAKARIPKGTLPDADAISIMVKAAIDGLVDAGILPGDDGDHVLLVGYGRPERDRTLTTRQLLIVLTDQHVPF